ncbi:hypothetical protein [Metabacillus halosaccharovorans]|uniref:DUF3168 domain-containing protein n=1 Tax=Metabacillus halosaccharovorans TaxID=930124 RepID=A0ABT3DGV3_9BACI|nr:hypothetical protein [Metabacillus halosaccharovorans]MCV9886241.1 hypothetical protein [Metabacillus halosaccharovorans]
MNEKQKNYLKKQNKGIYDNLTAHFNLPIFQDDLAEDEYPNGYNYFLLIFGDFESTDSINQVSQEIYVVYVTEGNDLVDEHTLDILTLISSVPGISFDRSIKQRLQKKDTDEFLDQVTVIFKRKMSHECKV